MRPRLEKIKNELEISELDFLLLLSCLKQIVFFGSFDELNKHKLCKLVAIRMSKHMLSISCTGALKEVSIFATKVGKNES